MNAKLKSILRETFFFFFDWKGQKRVDPLKTLYYNFRLFPFHTAKKLPLYIHCGVKTYQMGKIRIEGRISRRMIAIGGYGLKSQGVSKIVNKGEIVFKGPVILGGSTIIENLGQIVFEGETVAGEGNLFLIQKQLTIGQYTRIGFHCLWMDSNYHYMLHLPTGEIKTNKQAIHIGRCNWIASYTTVKKGTRTPDYTIVAAPNALLMKDYTSLFPPCSIIGGMPVRLIASGYRRISNLTEERRINRYFNEHPEADTLEIDLENTDLEAFCTNDSLKF
jgi:acetyltransferase-like isoleucine patch superfamily enzyme